MEEFDRKKRSAVSGYKRSGYKDFESHSSNRKRFFHRKINFPSPMIQGRIQRLLLIFPDDNLPDIRYSSAYLISIEQSSPL